MWFVRKSNEKYTYIQKGVTLQIHTTHTHMCTPHTLMRGVKNRVRQTEQGVKGKRGVDTIGAN